MPIWYHNLTPSKTHQKEKKDSIINSTPNDTQNYWKNISPNHQPPNSMIRKQTSKGTKSNYSSITETFNLARKTYVNAVQNGSNPTHDIHSSKIPTRQKNKPIKKS